MPADRADLTQTLNAAIVADLGRISDLARELPMGGLPRAANLARHSYVVCDALEHHLHQLEQQGETGGGEAGTEELRRALRDVEVRLERLFASDRTGGLDRIDLHMSRLHRAAKSRLPRHPTGPEQLDFSWWEALGHRRRARILAWLLTASATPARPLVSSQPLPTRLLLRVWYQHQAAARAARLGHPVAA